MILTTTNHGGDHISLESAIDLEDDSVAFIVVYCRLGVYRRYAYSSLKRAHREYKQLVADWEKDLTP